MPFFNNGEVKIHYQVDGSGPPLLLAHQATDSIDYWYRNGYVAKLKDTYQLIMPDIRGHGQSDKPDDPKAYQLKAIADDFRLLLDSLEIESCHAWGYSMGGGFTFGFAYYFPERLKSMVLGGSFPQNVSTDFGQLLEEGFKAGIEQGEDALIAYFTDWWGQMAEPLETRFRRLHFKALLAYIQSTNERPDLLPDLPKMQTPALFYAGSEDHGPHKYAPHAAKLMPNGNFISFPGFTHGTISPEADKVLARVLPFLAKNG